MAASALVSQLAHFLSFMREHPKLSFLLLLLLSPPIFRVLLYFTPLLLSTALCIFALITLAPYVTATDAEVERQSLLGTSSYQPKSKASLKDEQDAAGGLELKSSSADPSTSSLSPPFVSSVCLSVSASSSPTAENSWMSWMKGLNDISRAWVESKLSEQGLALSEPANRETLLALIEGSFAELVTVKENYADIFSTRSMDVGEDNIDNAMRLKDMDDDLLKESETENETREPMMLPKGGVSADVEANSVDNALDVHGADTLPAKSVTHDQVDESAQAAECLVGGDVRANHCASESELGLHNADETTSKPSNILHDAIPATMPKTPTSHDSALSVMDASADAAQSSTIMPKTPSRIPGPSKLIEASRRIFSKEEQSKSMLPRAPFQLSSRVPAFKPSIGGAAQSKFESTVSAMKLPTRKFLERSKSTSGKDGNKLSDSSSTEQRIDESGEEESRLASQETLKLQSNSRKRNANDSVHVSVSGCGDITEANVMGDGPKFDEDLEVEEAQALVRSELKMLELELEEVAAKLPKLEGALAYQKTPLKSATSATAAMLSPTRTPQLKGNMALFSTIPVSK
ncbi:hypothetical protein L7F22_037102 [Adiantum nelumboides]|nr:hypothetical protein [Adiantum nelumboides]